MNHSNIISGSGKRSDKIHELPIIPKELVGCVGKNGVLTSVLYISDVIISEDLTVNIVTCFQIFYLQQF